MGLHISFVQIRAFMNKLIAFGLLTLSFSGFAQASEFVTGDYRLVGCQRTCATSPASALEDPSFKKLVCGGTVAHLISIQKNADSLILSEGILVSKLGAGIYRDLSTYKVGTHLEDGTSATTSILNKNSLTEIDTLNPDNKGVLKVYRHEIQEDGSLVMAIDSKFYLSFNDVLLHTTTACRYIRSK